MNNEEKILSLLDTLVLGQAKLEQGQSAIVERLGNLEVSHIALTAKVAAIDSKVAAIDSAVIRLEHEQHEKFGALFDSHTLINEKLDRLQSTVDRHESVLESHSLNLAVLNSGKRVVV